MWHLLRNARRRSRALAAVLIASSLLAASACGTDGASDDGAVTLRFTWWGSDIRHEATQQVIDAYEKDHPNVTIKGEFGDWSGYWDKLATTVAANDAPDIIQMDEKYLREYAARGALLDLKDAPGLDTSKIEPDMLTVGEFDGSLYGLAAGINAYIMVANPALFETAGVALPDDTTWTWEEYTELAAELTSKLNGEAWGTGTPGLDDSEINLWARQHGESLWTEEGELGISKDMLTAFFEQVLEMQAAKAIPSAEFTAEDMTAEVTQRAVATGKLALDWTYTNHVATIGEAAGQEMKLLRVPSVTGNASDNGLFYKGAMFWSISSRSKHQEEAIDFINYLANSPAAGEIMLAERGLPPNTDVRAEVMPNLAPAEVDTANFIQAIRDELGNPPPTPPVGAGQVEEIIQRHTTDVLFGRQTPEEAAQAFIDEVNSELG